MSQTFMDVNSTLDKILSLKPKKRLNKEKEVTSIAKPRKVHPALLVAYSGLKKDYESSSLANLKREFIPLPLFEAIRDFSLNDRLILSGCTGSGKTVIAKGLIRKFTRISGNAGKIQSLERGKDCLQRRFSCLFAEESSIYWNVQSAFRDNAGETFLEKNDYFTAPLLVIDDLGVSTRTASQIEILLEIVNARNNYNLPTIFTTNLSLDAIKKHYGSRVFSRLNEFKFLETAKKDLRASKFKS